MLVLATALLPNLAVALVLHFLSVLLLAAMSGPVASAIPVDMLATQCAMLLFHAALGLAVGSAFRPVVAIPLALAVSYCWLGFTGTTEDPALRHLAGLVLETCCTADQQPAPASLIATSTFSVIGALALMAASARLLQLGRRSAPLDAVLPVGLLVVALVVGLTFARDLGYTATVPRDRAALECSGAQPAVCLFPEQLAARDVRASIGEMVRRLEGTGIEVPDVVEAGSGGAGAGRLSVVVAPTMDERELAASLATSIVGPGAPACAEDPEAAIARGELWGNLVVWVAVRLEPSVEVAHFADAFGADTGSIERLLAAEAATQSDWVDAAQAATTSCAADPAAAALP